MRHNHINISFTNDGTYTDECINMPIIVNDTTVIGIINSVSDTIVSGIVWDRYIQKEVINGIPSCISILSPSNQSNYYIT